MSRSDMGGREPATGSPARALWQRCRMIEAVEDEAAHYLDLAGFADGRLDADDSERVAALLAADPAAAADVAAARALAGAGAAALPADEGIIARARTLVAAGEPGRVLRFAAAARYRPHVPGLSLPGLARWGSLAAAIVVAGWLGFAMGSDASQTLDRLDQSSDDGFLHEILDPSNGFLPNFTEGMQT